MEEVSAGFQNPTAGGDHLPPPGMTNIDQGWDFNVKQAAIEMQELSKIAESTLQSDGNVQNKAQEILNRLYMHHQCLTIFLCDTQMGIETEKIKDKKRLSEPAAVRLDLTSELPANIMDSEDDTDDACAQATDTSHTEPLASLITSEQMDNAFNAQQPGLRQPIDENFFDFEASQPIEETVPADNAARVDILDGVETWDLSKQTTTVDNNSLMQQHNTDKKRMGEEDVATATQTQSKPEIVLIATACNSPAVSIPSAEPKQMLVYNVRNDGPTRLIIVEENSVPEFHQQQREIDAHVKSSAARFITSELIADQMVLVKFEKKWCRGVVEQTPFCQRIRLMDLMAYTAVSHSKDIVMTMPEHISKMPIITIKCMLTNPASEMKNFTRTYSPKSHQVFFLYLEEEQAPYFGMNVWKAHIKLRQKPGPKPKTQGPKRLQKKAIK